MVVMIVLALSHLLHGLLLGLLGEHFDLAHLLHQGESASVGGGVTGVVSVGSVVANELDYGGDHVGDHPDGDEVHPCHHVDLTGNAEHGDGLSDEQNGPDSTTSGQANSVGHLPVVHGSRSAKVLVASGVVFHAGISITTVSEPLEKVAGGTKHCGHQERHVGHLWVIMAVFVMVVMVFVVHALVHHLVLGEFAVNVAHRVVCFSFFLLIPH